MLKQILRDMYVDPEILTGLDDTQKQTLFCKMREEQIRRWRLWDQKHERLEAEAGTERSQPQRVQFRHGEDGEPWVWIMGEHENDRTIDEILADEAKQRARQLAEIETKELRKSYVADIVNQTNIIDFAVADCGGKPDAALKKLSDDDDESTSSIVNDLEIYCTVDEIRDRLSAKQTDKSQIVTDSPAAVTVVQQPTRPLVNFNLNHSAPAHKPDVLREITHSHQRPGAQKVSARIALWEKRVIGEKTNEILKLLQQKQQDAAAEAEDAARTREQEWQEQERRAKVAEVQMRDIARKAREEHRKSITGELPQQTSHKYQHRSASLSSTSSLSSSSLDDVAGSGGLPNGGSPPSSLDSTVSRPPSADAVIRWYRDEEFPRKGSGIDPASNRPHRWFHGMLSRADAERLLADAEAGTFLVRLSDKIWGYVISYRDAERCKHYLIDASVAGSYQFLGANQLNHDSLNDLIRFHANVPITLLGQELLLRSCSAGVQQMPKLLHGLID